MTLHPAPKPMPIAKEPRQRFRRRIRGVPPAVRQQVFERANFTCEWCGERGGHLDPHHVQRRSQGGSDSIDNLRALHRRCHRYVHEHPAEAKERGFLA